MQKGRENLEICVNKLSKEILCYYLLPSFLSLKFFVLFSKTFDQHSDEKMPIRYK